MNWRIDTTSSLSENSWRYPLIARVLILSAGTHLAIGGVKVAYALKIHSIAMMAHGFHSTIHASGVLFAIGGIYLATRPTDVEHPYGYERYELLTALGPGGFFVFQRAARHMHYRSRRCGAAVMIQAGEGRYNPP